MTNASQYSGGPNPGLVAVGLLEAGLRTAEAKSARKQKFARLQAGIEPTSPYDEAMAHQEHIEQSLYPHNEEHNMSTHPITGEQVPTVPVKRSKYKQTAPGTRPKKK